MREMDVCASGFILNGFCGKEMTYCNGEVRFKHVNMFMGELNIMNAILFEIGFYFNTKKDVFMIPHFEEITNCNEDLLTTRT